MLSVSPAGCQVDDQRVGRAVVGELAGQVDVLVEGAAGLLPRSTSVTVLALIELGSIGPLKVMLIVHGVALAAGDAADRVERDVGVEPWSRRLGDARDLRRVQVDVLVGTDVDERIAAEADARTADLRCPDVPEDVALAGDRRVVVGSDERCRRRVTVGVGGQGGLPLVREAEEARSRQGDDLAGIIDDREAAEGSRSRPGTCREQQRGWVGPILHDQTAVDCGRDRG